ncbi:membrane protein insertion efficiency factor YidD [Pseudonocardiaceae bacterium YIM PH 21723]|nr:membrane protein insertion efficiency factor YidD [Pseudonocardiaceae bacterium YIM PH 21723]
MAKRDDWRKAMDGARRDADDIRKPGMCDRMSGGRSPSRNWTVPGEGSGGYNQFTLRPSTVLLLVSRVAPGRPLTVLGLRFYRRLLARFTPVCPQPVSCSRYTLDAVHRFGARRGLRLGAARVRACG